MSLRMQAVSATFGSFPLVSVLEVLESDESFVI